MKARYTETQVIKVLKEAERRGQPAARMSGLEALRAGWTRVVFGYPLALNLQ